MCTCQTIRRTAWQVNGQTVGESNLPSFVLPVFFIEVVSILILPKIRMRRILCYILHLSGDDLTTCSSLPFSCPRNIFATIALPKTNITLPLKINGWKMKFLFCVSALFSGCKLAVRFQGGYLFIQAKERCAFNCRFFRNVLNATGTAQGAGECWWDGGEDADGGGSFGEKTTENSKRNHTSFSVFDYKSMILDYKSTDSKEIHSEEETFRINDHYHCWARFPPEFLDGTHGKRPFFERKRVVGQNPKRNPF